MKLIPRQMGRLISPLCLSLLAASTAVCIASASEADAASVGVNPKAVLHLHHSYDEALAEAKKTGKPLLVVFRCAP